MAGEMSAEREQEIARLHQQLAAMSEEEERRSEPLFRRLEELGDTSYSVSDEELEGLRSRLTTIARITMENAALKEQLADAQRIANEALDKNVRQDFAYLGERNDALTKLAAAERLAEEQEPAVKLADLHIATMRAEDAVREHIDPCDACHTDIASDCPELATLCAEVERLDGELRAALGAWETRDAALASTPAPPPCWWDAPPPCPLHGASVFLCPEAKARA